MNLLEFAFAIVAGGIGAGARYIVDTRLTRGRTEAFPIGILVVNITGSGLLGLLVASPVAGGLLSILGIGLLGGYTTFSTVAVDTVRLGRAGRRDWAWANLLGTFGASVTAAAVGLVLGGLIPG